MSRHDDRAESISRTQEYEKPEVTSEEVFETLALGCVKAAVQCTTAPGEPVVQS